MATLEASDHAPSLELNEDLVFQRKQWVVQRVCWVLMVFLIIAALLGLLGPGPLSKTTAADPTAAVAVEYDRIEHDSAASEIKIRVAASQAVGNTVQLMVNQAYMQSIQVQSVSPPPMKVEQNGENHLYTFATDARADLELSIHYEHKAWGRSEGRIGLVSGQAVAFTQTVLP